MAEIPEHLLARAKAAREKAAAKAGAEDTAAAPAAATPASAGDSKIPAHLLERSRAAKAKREGGSTDAPSGATAVAASGGGGAVAAPTLPIGAGPSGHTQRLLTVVKSGSIQDVKSKPQDKVHVWPHLLIMEFVAALFLTAFTTIFSIFVNAPLLELANPNQTTNPSKAPAHHVPPDGGWCDHSRHGIVPPDLGSICRSQSVEQA